MVYKIDKLIVWEEKVADTLQMEGSSLDPKRPVSVNAINEDNHPNEKEKNPTASTPVMNEEEKLVADVSSPPPSIAVVKKQ